MVEVGQKAPDFSLKDQNEKEVRLSGFIGRRVLITFFPFAFSPVCTEEFGCFYDDLEIFKNKGVEVVGISVDSHWSNRAFADKLGINFPLLSDFGKDVSRKYDVLRKEGFSERAYFLIDENGIVRYKHVMGVPGKKLDNKEILDAIDGI